MTQSVRHGARRSALALLIFTALLTAGCASAAEPIVVLAPPTDSPRVLVVKGLNAGSLDAFDRLKPDRRQEVLRAWVADAPTGAPPVLGRATRRGNELIFTPRYPFQPGLKYRTRFDPSMLSGAAAPVESEISVPAPPDEAVVDVVAIYPTSDELPENLLKFYIHFSGPMSRGEVYEHVHLLDDKGQAVVKPFLELEEELWNSQMTRFTLFFDPGRIKHGLVSQMQLGPALEAGRTYRLVVDVGWRDAGGRPLLCSASKTFRAAPAERRGPDPARWRITPPRSASTDALAVVFDEPLDHAMLQRVLSVHDAGGQRLHGTITVSDHERQWCFSPESRWHAGHYTLWVEAILEDVAGNSIGRPFEVDLNQQPTTPAPNIVEIPFDVR